MPARKSGVKPRMYKPRLGSSFGSVSAVLARPAVLGCALLVSLVLATTSCGDDGLFPTSVDPGNDFVQEDAIFDDEFYYCRVEPMLFAAQQSCGSGVAGKDPANGCHFSVTKFRLTDYAPLVATTCEGDAFGPMSAETMAAEQNYTAAQARMKRDPQLAALLQRPLGNAQHPRQIFTENSAEADVIRRWATQSSSP
jgi:hypothetical protein